MKRRAALVAIGVGALSGCLGNGGTSTTGTAENTETPAFDPDGQVETIEVGTNPGEIVPHGVVIWNSLETARTVHIRVFDASDGETRHENSYDLPADTALGVKLRSPATYRLTLRVPAADAERTISVPERLFDTCNESYTHVSIRTNGRITERTMTTELECVSPTSPPTSDQ